jgi:hypothetical protein
VALVGTALLLIGAAKPIALDDLIGFKRQGICENTPAFENLIRSSYRVIDKEGRLAARQPAVAARYRAAFGKIGEKRERDWTSIILPLHNARWGGLPIIELAFHFPVGGDPAHISLRFRARIAQVRAALAAKRLRAGVVDDGIYVSEMKVGGVAGDPSSVFVSCGMN